MIPPGPDRRTLILHLTQEFNFCTNYILDDRDGAQARDVLFIGERLRRSLSVLKAYLERNSPQSTRQGLEIVAQAVRGVLRALANRQG